MLKPEHIDKIVSEKTGISVELMHSNSLKREVTDARNLAMLKYKQHLKFSSHKIRKHYGKDAHSTILSDLKSAQNEIDTKQKAAELANWVDCAIEAKKNRLLSRKQEYNLHYRIRKKGLMVDTNSKTISVPEARKTELEKGQLLKLVRQHGYHIQYSII